jgi:hypothetical protein
MRGNQMQKLALGAVVTGLLVVACHGNNNKVVDANNGSGGPICDPIHQTGCPADTPRCTWVQDTSSIGHVDCEAAGTVALGGDCMAGSAFPAFDNCDAGAICISGKCETICDNNAGGSACGSGFACGIYSGLFEVNGNFEAGACDKTCDPLADNRFGTGSAGDPLPPKTGTTCGSGQGCYGFPSSNAMDPTHFTCSAEINTDLTHRSACLVSTNPSQPGCSADSTHVFLNGCAQGYIPLLNDKSLGSTNAVCIAYCIPQDCYQGSGNCGSGSDTSNTSAGKEPHACSLTDIRVGGVGAEALPTGSAAANNSCIYSWVFEEDTMGAIAESSFDNTLGFCYDHSKYQYDSNGNKMIDSGDAFDPPCNQLPGSGSGINAADLGCISTTTATTLGDITAGSGSGSAFRQRTHNTLVDMPRFPQAAAAALRMRTR